MPSSHPSLSYLGICRDPHWRSFDTAERSEERDHASELDSIIVYQRRLRHRFEVLIDGTRA